MTHKSALSRRERAAARGAPAWRWRDTLSFLILAPFLIAAIFAPALIADVGDTVIGPQTYIPGLGLTWAQTALMVMRWGVIFLGGYALFAVRAFPMAQRVQLLLIMVGLSMNYARSVYSGSPLTLSFLLLLLGLLVNHIRLMARPTIWQDLQEARDRAATAEARCGDWQERAIAAEAKLDRLNEVHS